MTEDEDPLDRLYKLLTAKKRVRMRPRTGPLQPRSGPGSFKDLTGRNMGLGTIVQRGPHSIDGNVSWLYLCECGMARWLQSSNLRRSPPKTHKFCFRGVKFVAEAVDSVRETTYNTAS